jgi:hypothetical protein
MGKYRKSALGERLVEDIESRRWSNYRADVGGAVGVLPDSLRRAAME